MRTNGHAITGAATPPPRHDDGHDELERFVLGEPIRIPPTDDNGPTYARRFILERGVDAEGRLLLARWAERWYWWRGRHFVPLEDEAIRKDVRDFLEQFVILRPAKKDGDGPTEVPVLPTPKRKNETLDDLRDQTHEGLDVLVRSSGEVVRLPQWRTGEDRPPAEDLLPVANGILHVPTGDLLPPTPELFTLGSSDFAWDPNATCGRWLDWLHEQVDDDDTIAMLQEFGGYCLTARNAIHRFLLLLGPPRTGKSTFARVLTQVLGETNVAAAAASDLSHRFGLEVVVGKRLLLVGDARFHQRAGGAIDRLLTIPGGDTVQIDRKNRSPLVYQPECKLLLAANDMPRLPDASGAVARRIMVARFDRSFAGREDHGVEGRLLEEGSGILRWFVEGFRRLAARAAEPGGRWAYTEPEATAEVRREIIRLGSPIQSFVDECCELAADRWVSKDDLYAGFRRWAEEAAGIKSPDPRETFFRDLLSAFPEIKDRRRRETTGERIRRVDGIGLVVGTVARPATLEQQDSDHVDGMPV